MQEPWGELRDDLRMAAMLTLMNDADSDVSPVYPYIETEDEQMERKAELDQRKKTLDPVVMEAKLRKAREEHFAKRGGVRG